MIDVLMQTGLEALTPMSAVGILLTYLVKAIVDEKRVRKNGTAPQTEFGKTMKQLLENSTDIHHVITKRDSNDMPRCWRTKELDKAVSHLCEVMTSLDKRVDEQNKVLHRMFDEMDLRTVRGQAKSESRSDSQ